MADGAADILLLADVSDDLLRLLFACCDDSIPVESQLVFALKTGCGFDVREIAQRLFATEGAVSKRLTRARSRLLALQPSPDELDAASSASRLPAVQSILYLMFTEGYLSSHASMALRRELCKEAKRLRRLLAEHPLCGTPETAALMALMHLHAARMAARRGTAHALLLLQEQDRSAWDHDEIAVGLSWLARSGQGPTFSRYHAEAGIAAEHCLAPTLAQTRWDRIVLAFAQSRVQAGGQPTDGGSGAFGETELLPLGEDTVAVNPSQPGVAPSASLTLTSGALRTAAFLSTGSFRGNALAVIKDTIFITGDLPVPTTLTFLMAVTGTIDRGDGPIPSSIPGSETNSGRAAASLQANTFGLGLPRRRPSSIRTRARQRSRLRARWEHRSPTWSRFLFSSTTPIARFCSRPPCSPRRSTEPMSTSEAPAG